MGYDLEKGGTIEDMQQQQQEQDWPWPVGVAEGNALRDLGVLWWSTKIGFNDKGIITYRDGYGGRFDDTTWREAFLSLVQPS